VAGIVHGERAISADTALRLGRYFGTTPDLWLRLQQQYDLRVARRERWPEISGRVQPLDITADPVVD
jgi:antitoxin HigA-1